MTKTYSGSGNSRILVILGLAAAAVLALFFLRPGGDVRRPQADKNLDHRTAGANEPDPVPERVSVAVAAAPRRESPLTQATVLPTPTSALPALPAPTTETRQLVNSLVQLQLDGGGLTPEQAAAWRTNLLQLATHGAVGIPAIKEFLDKNTDFEFGAGGKQLLGYSSARLALLDVLVQAGGPEAIGVLTGVLGVTADPREIATVAMGLEQLEPGVHRQEALDAARQALAMAAEGKLPDRDVAALFEVFQNYGDAGLATELAANSKRWNYYSMFALAQLPESAGIATLVQIANGEGGFGSGARVPAIEMLGQVAGESEVARSALLDLAKQNKLSAYNWATLECILAGDEVRFQDSAFDASLAPPKPGDLRRTHINSGNQNFYSAPPAGGLTPEQFQQQKDLIKSLREVTTDANGLQVLQRADALLDRRGAQLTATAPPTRLNP